MDPIFTTVDNITSTFSEMSFEKKETPVPNKDSYFEKEALDLIRQGYKLFEKRKQASRSKALSCFDKAVNSAKKIANPVHKKNLLFRIETSLKKIGIFNDPMHHIENGNPLKGAKKALELSPGHEKDWALRTAAIKFVENGELKSAIELIASISSSTIREEPRSIIIQQLLEQNETEEAMNVSFQFPSSLTRDPTHESIFKKLFEMNMIDKAISFHIENCSERFYEIVYFGRQIRSELIKHKQFDIILPFFERLAAALSKDPHKKYCFDSFTFESVIDLAHIEPFKAIAKLAKLISDVSLFERSASIILHKRDLKV